MPFFQRRKRKDSAKSQKQPPLPHNPPPPSRRYQPDLPPTTPLRTIWFSVSPSDPLHRHAPGYPAPLVIGTTTYPSAEHLYHCIKFSRYRNRPIVQAILSSPTGLQAREIAYQNREVADRWSDLDALDARRFTLGVKYAQHVDLLDDLVEKCGGYIVFESRDTFWGRRKSDDLGYNELGRALMETRARAILERRSDMRSIVVASWRHALRA